MADQRYTPMARPTTLGSLLARPFMGTGQVATGPDQTTFSLFGPASRSTYVPMAFRLGTRVAPAPIIPAEMLAAEDARRAQQLSNQAPDGFNFVSPDPRGLLSEMERAPRPATPIAAPPAAPSAAEMGQGGLLGRMGQSVRERAGGLLTGEGSSARLRALGQALLTGPSRTPVSFGQSLMRGLAAGEEAVEREEMAEFAKEQRARQKKQIEAQNKLADVLADPEATDTEKKSAFKAAYPVEAFKAEGKPVDLVKQIGDIAIRKKQAGIPLTEVEQDAYDKRMSAGGFDLMKEYQKQVGMAGEPDSVQPRDTRVLATPAQQQAREELERRRRQREER